MLTRTDQNMPGKQRMCIQERDCVAVLVYLVRVYVPRRDLAEHAIVFGHRQLCYFNAIEPLTATCSMMSHARVTPPASAIDCCTRRALFRNASSDRTCSTADRTEVAETPRNLTVFPAPHHSMRLAIAGCSYVIGTATSGTAQLNESSTVFRPACVNVKDARLSTSS